MATWVTQSEAARRETEAGRPINQSSISRFLAGNPDVAVQRSPDGKRIQFVDYDDLVKARGGSLAVQEKLFERAPAAPVAAPAGEPKGDTTSERIRSAKAKTAEIELAELEGRLISRAGVVAGMENIGAEFVQALERRRRTLANRLAGMTDVRAIELELKRADSELRNILADALDQVAGEMVARAAEPEADEADGDEAAAA